MISVVIKRKLKNFITQMKQWHWQRYHLSVSVCLVFVLVCTSRPSWTWLVCCGAAIEKGIEANAIANCLSKLPNYQYGTVSNQLTGW